MHLYVCMYVCVYVCMHVCFYACMFICTCMHTCMHACMCGPCQQPTYVVCIHTKTHTHTHTSIMYTHSWKIFESHTHIHQKKKHRPLLLMMFVWIKNQKSLPHTIHICRMIVYINVKVFIYARTYNYCRAMYAQGSKACVYQTAAYVHVFLLLCFLLYVSTYTYTCTGMGSTGQFRVVFWCSREIGKYLIKAYM